MTAREIVVQCAKDQLNDQYKWATAGPDTFDCSGLTSYCYGKAGYSISRGSVEQARLGKSIPRAQAQPGDILIYGNDASHVGLVVGPNQAIHALNNELDIRVTAIDGANLGKPLVDVRSILPDNETTNPKVPNTGENTGEKSLVFGTLKPPPYDTRIVVKPWVGAGYDVVPPRNNIGMCMHKWWGYGDRYSLYRLFSTGGERQADALTDWSLTQEGELVMLNEPWKTRAGWANGPANDLEGDGIQFVRQLGVSAVNGRLVSVEFEGKDETLTQAQMNIGSSLWAYYYDAWKVPYTQYPLHPKFNLVTDLDHWEIGDKACPFAGARSQRSAFQDMVRGKLKAAQTKTGTDVPVPPVNPPVIDHEWLPDGMTEDMVKTLFGTLTRHNIDGTTTKATFDKKGVISNAWLARGAELRMYPAAQNWFKLSDDDRIRNVISFSNGWVFMGNDNDRASWKWL